jgi:hypothetical protein
LFAELLHALLDWCVAFNFFRETRLVEMARRPSDEIASVFVHNDKDTSGKWIPMKLEVGSWVTLQHERTGVWGRDAQRHGGDTFGGAYKGQILKFRFTMTYASDSLRAPKMELEAVKVRHAYMRRQLELEPTEHLREPRHCNYLYLSYFDNWVHPESILSVIYVLHVEIGEAIRNGRSHRSLLENGTFFLRAVYVPPALPDLYGTLETLPLPDLDDPGWPLPDMHTSEAYRSKLACDFCQVMKASTGSKFGRIQWFLPSHVFADFFAVASRYVRKTPTLYIINQPCVKLLSSLMDPEWNEKIQIGEDIVKCLVSTPSICFRYLWHQATVYAKFRSSKFVTVLAHGVG